MRFFPKLNKKNEFFQPNHTLTDLANSLETDKGNENPSNLSWGKDFPEHICMDYTGTYERYMNEYRNKPVKLFEIGICDKRFPYASPKMWLSYFNQVDLYCMDNYWGTYLDEKLDEVKMINEWGVNFIYADQGNFCDWNELKQKCPNNFDFFVEDGSHWPNHMIVSLWQAKDLLKSGGYYFMEDLQNPATSRGKFKYDNSILTEDLLTAEHSGILKSRLLNDRQNTDIRDNFELVELILDKKEINYLGVFKKK